MANTIELTDKFLPILDEVFKAESKTAVLETSGVLVQETKSANTFKIYKLSLQGAGNYDKATGFPQGAIVGEWEDFTFAYDRGRTFNVDAVDDMETLNLTAANAMSSFIREMVIPEMDAVRFAKYYAGTPAANKIAETITTSDAAQASLENALESMQDNEVPDEGNFIFMTPAFARLLRKSVARTVFNAEGSIVNRISDWNGNRIIIVPSARFNTAVTLLDGKTSGQEQGGYTVSGKTINYLIVNPRSVMQITKHSKIRNFDPDTNQQADAWKFDFRAYHDAWVLENKANGLYASAAE